MATKSAKKAQIRSLILNAAHTYAKDLAGKVFLYVYGDEYLEIVFRKDCFLHLTGVDTLLSANDVTVLVPNGPQIKAPVASAKTALR